MTSTNTTSVSNIRTKEDILKAVAELLSGEDAPIQEFVAFIEQMRTSRRRRVNQQQARRENGSNESSGVSNDNARNPGSSKAPMTPSSRRTTTVRSQREEGKRMDTNEQSPSKPQKRTIGTSRGLPMKQSPQGTRQSTSTATTVTTSSSRGISEGVQPPGGDTSKSPRRMARPPSSATNARKGGDDDLGRKSPTKSPIKVGSSTSSPRKLSSAPDLCREGEGKPTTTTRKKDSGTSQTQDKSQTTRIAPSGGGTNSRPLTPPTGEQTTSQKSKISPRTIMKDATSPIVSPSSKRKAVSTKITSSSTSSISPKGTEDPKSQSPSSTNKDKKTMIKASKEIDNGTAPKEIQVVKTPNPQDKVIVPTILLVPKDALNVSSHSTNSNGSRKSLKNYNGEGPPSNKILALDTESEESSRGFQGDYESSMSDFSFCPSISSCLEEGKKDMTRDMIPMRPRRDDDSSSISHSHSDHTRSYDKDDGDDDDDDDEDENKKIKDDEGNDRDKGFPGASDSETSFCPSVTECLQSGIPRGSVPKIPRRPRSPTTSPHPDRKASAVVEIMSPCRRAVV